MTFGLVKSIIEENILESYKDETSFKKAINEFKHNVLNNKDFSKIYSIYDELSKPQGLSPEDAKEFLQEGIYLIQKMIQNVKLPKLIGESKVENKYKNIDDLVYSTNKVNLHERVLLKKQIVSVLKESKKETSSDKIGLPISSMVKIANQTISNYIENLDENTKKELFEIIKEDSKNLEEKFNNLVSSTLEKLNPILEDENNEETKKTLRETIERVKSEKFSQVNFLKLKKLNEAL